MADVVFVLGAGASKRAGVPLMPGFLDTAYRLWKLGEARPADADFQRVFGAISKLQLVHSKATLDIQNVESVFAAFDMAALLGRFADYTADDLKQLAASMRRVIAQTVELTTNFPYSGGRLHPPPPYEAFVGLINHLGRESKPQRSVALLTFNYDIALDYTLHFTRTKFTYGFDGKGTAHGVLPLLKLHGSINWFRCPGCTSVAPWPLGDFFQSISFSPYTDSDVHLNLSAFAAKNFKHCPRHTVDPDAALVPPTWNKTDHHREIASVWSVAAEELSQAEAVVLIGYSLPESDAFFRYLYALGAVGASPLKLFLVVNPDESAATRERFEALLGPGARQRFDYRPLLFEESMKELKSLLSGI